MTDGLPEEECALRAIDDVIECDEQNLRHGKENLARLHPDGLETAELVSRIFVDTADALGRVPDFVEKEAAVQAWCDEQGIPLRDAYRLFEDATLIGDVEGEDPRSEVRSQLIAVIGYYARAYMLLRLNRDYLFGFTDLLKNRVIASIGYLRIQCETFALLKLILRDPEVGVKWWNAGAGKRGRKFFDANKHDLKNIMREHDLAIYYDQASSMALHSRVAGIAYAAQIDGIGPDESGQRALRLSFQDTEDANTYFLHFTTYIRVHRIIISEFPRLFPELPDSDKRTEQIAKLRSNTAALEETWKGMCQAAKGERRQRSWLLWLPEYD